MFLKLIIPHGDCDVGVVPVVVVVLDLVEHPALALVRCW
jgi:hypothetical protein